MQRSYTVVGMTCNHCIDRVTAGVSSVPGVQRAQAQVEDGQLVVIGQDFTDTAIRRAVEDAGYQITI